MNTSTRSKEVHSVYKFFNENIKLFSLFESVFLFGSILDIHKQSNDIDLLLIYSVYSDEIIESCNLIGTLLQTKIGLYTDLTVLSIKEQEEIKFFDKIGSQWLQLK